MMPAKRFGEVEGLDQWSGRMNEIMDEMLNRSYVEYRDSRTWQPPTNVYETSREYRICAEIGGMRLEEIEVVCRNDRCVVISGQRPMPRPDVPERLCVHVLEVDEGPFEREIDLPDPVDVDRVQVEYERGYLWITLFKLEATDE